jgi:hypothetical protein
VSAVVTLATELVDRAVLRYGMLLGAPLERIIAESLAAIRAETPRAVRLESSTPSTPRSG